MIGGCLSVLGAGSVLISREVRLIRVRTARLYIYAVNLLAHNL